MGTPARCAKSHSTFCRSDGHHIFGGAADKDCHRQLMGDRHEEDHLHCYADLRAGRRNSGSDRPRSACRSAESVCQQRARQSHHPSSGLVNGVTFTWSRHVLRPSQRTRRWPWSPWEELRPPLIAAKPQPDFSRRELWPRARRLTVFRESGAGLSSKKTEVDVLGQHPSSYMSAD
jgi:hypothetical protein